MNKRRLTTLLVGFSIPLVPIIKEHLVLKNMITKSKISILFFNKKDANFTKKEHGYSSKKN